MGKLNMFVVLVSFWVILTIFSFTFGHQLINGDISEMKPEYEPQGFDKLLSGFIDSFQDVPVVKSFVPIIKLLTLQYTTDIPVALILVLDATLIFTGYLFVEMLFSRG